MHWKVPFADIQFSDNEKRAVLSVINSGWISMGNVTEKFENNFKTISGTKYNLAVSSGTAALHLACLCAGLGPGDEALLPSLSFVATANAVVYSGAKPVFCDVKGIHDLTIDPMEIAKKITRKTKAIIIVHYGGYPCDLTKIKKLARKHQLFLIEDAAHAHGASFSNRKIGSWGDIGCFSFFSNKNMTTGEGGMLTTNNKKFSERIRLYRTHGMTSSSFERYQGKAFNYDVIQLGYNYRITEIQAALGIHQLRALPRNNQKRRQIISRYSKIFNEFPELIIPFQKPRGNPVHHLYPIVFPDKKSRMAFRIKMADRGIQTSVHYPPIHLNSWYKKFYKTKKGDLPITEKFSNRMVTLPVYPKMSPQQVNFVVNEAVTILRGNLKFG